MTNLIYWKCDGCRETLQGVMADGDFISDKELDSGRPKHLRAVGCCLCGCPTGDAVGVVDDEDDS